MPRNSLGVYTVPPGTPAVPLTTIGSSAYNNFLNDISTAISQSVWTTGGSQMTGGLKVNMTGASQPPDASAQPPDLIHVSGATGQTAAITIDSMNSSGAYLYLRAGFGSWSSPAAIGGSGNFGGVVARAFNGVGWMIMDSAGIYFGSPAQWGAGGVGYPAWIKFMTTSVTPGANPAVAGVIQSSGGWNIGDVYSTQTMFDPGAGSLLVQNKIVIAPTTSQVPQVALPTPIGAPLLQAGAASGTTSILGSESNAAATALYFRRSQGTWGAPTPTAGLIGAIQAYGYANAAYTTVPSAEIDIRAATTWTATDHSTSIALLTTPSGTTTQIEAARFQPSGGLSVGNSAFNATDPGQGVIAAQNGVMPGAPMADNRIINGGFDVWQLGTSFSVATSTLSYTADQWMAYTNFGTLSILKGTGPGYTSLNVLNFGITACPNGSGCQILQPLESAQVGDLDSQPVTASFTMATTQGGGSTLLGNLLLNGNTATDNSTWSVVICNVSFTVPGATPTRVVVPLTAAQTVGLKFGARFVLGFTQSGATNNFSANIGAVQLTKGPVAQPWAPKGIAREIADCERYFEKSYDMANAPGTATGNGQSVYMFPGSIGNGGYTAISTQFRVRKRVAPTMTVYSTASGTAGNITYNGVNNAAALAGAAQTNTGILQNNSGAAWGDTASANWQWTADARL